MATLEKKRTGEEMTTSPKQELMGTEGTRPGPQFMPAVDIFETDETIVLLADMPGVTQDGLKIDLRDHVLTIDGEVPEITGKNEQSLLREYDTGSFFREFRLSDAIDQERITASLRDGVLRLTLPKAAAVRPRKIEVQAG